MLTAIVVIELVLIALFEWNLASYKPFGSRRPLATAYPAVSVLVPCRNEARNIERCVGSLLSQDYPDFEIIVFDDDSDDGTAEILERLRARDSRLAVIRGGVLPPGWTGKNRGCHELSKRARGEWFLFVDADTFHGPRMLRRAMDTAIEGGAGLLSTFPRQVFHSAGDELLVPLVFFVLLSFLPVYFVSKRTWRWVGEFSAACGQFLLFKRDAYEAVGGHEALKSAVSEACLFASRVKATRRRILLRDGSQWVSCAMYRGFREAFRGFSRSIGATMSGSVPAVLFFVVMQTYLFVVPAAAAAIFLAHGHFGIQTATALLAFALPLWIRLRIHRRAGMPVRLIALHPLAMFLYNAVILNSFYRLKFMKTAVWKNRVYDSVPC